MAGQPARRGPGPRGAAGGAAEPGLSHGLAADVRTMQHAEPGGSSSCYAPVVARTVQVKGRPQTWRAWAGI